MRSVIFKEKIDCISESRQLIKLIGLTFEETEQLIAEAKDNDFIINIDGDEFDTFYNHCKSNQYWLRNLNILAIIDSDYKQKFEAETVYFEATFSKVLVYFPEKPISLKYDAEKRHDILRRYIENKTEDDVIEVDRLDRIVVKFRVPQNERYSIIDKYKMESLYYNKLNYGDSDFDEESY